MEVQFSFLLAVFELAGSELAGFEPELFVRAARPEALAEWDGLELGSLRPDWRLLEEQPLRRILPGLPL